MTFVNEYPSEEDIKKYDLDEVWLRYHPVYQREEKLPHGFEHQWTVDRERDCYFMVVGGGGREAMETGTQCVLYWKKKYYTIYIRSAPGCSIKFTEQPFKVIWELVRIEQLEPGDEYDEVVTILKEALAVHGVDGIEFQVPNTIVEFTF